MEISNNDKNNYKKIADVNKDAIRLVSLCLKKISKNVDQITKGLMLTSLYLRKIIKMQELNRKQERLNKSIDKKRKKIEKDFSNAAKDIIDGNYKKRRSNRYRIFSPKIIALNTIFILIFLLFSKIEELQRGYKALGGEVIFIIIPCLIIFYRIGKKFEG